MVNGAAVADGVFILSTRIENKIKVEHSYDRYYPARITYSCDSTFVSCFSE